MREGEPPPLEYPPDMDHRERLRMAEAEIVRLRDELAKEADAKHRLISCAADYALELEDLRAELAEALSRCGSTNY